MDTFNNTVPASSNAALNKGPLGGRTQGALEPSGADLLGGNTALGAQQTGYAGQQQTGLTGSAGMNEVCDPPTIYNAAGAQAAVNYVHDNQRERTYEPLDVNKTVVQHEIERVKPVLHQEEHRTVLHEVVHHKVDAPRDLGITQVVHHGHTDPCGNPLSGIPGAVGTGAVGSGLNTSTATTDYTGTTGTGTGYQSTNTGASYGQTEQTHQEPHGIKGMINKVVPGPGPFKA